MSTVDINGVTVYASAIESVADGVSHMYDRLWDRAVHEMMSVAWTASSLEDIQEKQDEIVLPEQEDYPAVIVKLTSGREFRIVGKTRGEVEQEILLAKRRDRS